MDAKKAIQAFSSMLERRYSTQTKEEIRKVIDLLKADKLHEAYTYINFQTYSGLTVKVPWDVWKWLIEQ